jgi:hypothetical protein
MFYNNYQTIIYFLKRKFGRFLHFIKKDLLKLLKHKKTKTSKIGSRTKK